MFRTFLPLHYAYGNDPFTIWLNVIGGVFIGISFLIWGVLCVVTAGVDERKGKRAIFLTQLFGFVLIACALARFVDVLCVWHNYAILNGYIKILTGVLGILGLILVPFVLKESYSRKTYHEVDQKLEETSKKLDNVQELAKKLENPKK